MVELSHNATDPPPVNSASSVVVHGVHHSYGDGASRKPVLSDIELIVAHGEFVVLTGHSGAGKTTLLTLIGAIRSLQRGTINVLGMELSGPNPVSQRKVRRKIGFIFQDHNLFSALTAFRTLWLTTELADRPLSRPAAVERARDLLSQLEMEKYLHAFPRELSTGQKQRIAVARALINDPQLILGDEPTASLDHGSSLLVINLIKRHLSSTNASALVVTHDERIFDLADRVVRLEDGRLVAAQ